MDKERLDVLVQRVAGVTRSQAQGLIQMGRVYGPNGERLDKPGLRLAPDTPIEVRQGPRFVSRGGEKLEAALDHFQIDVTGRIAIDVGASTGGFTDCLLQRGASKVYAVDVGYGQLAWSLRQDPRVVVMERCNARHLTAEAFPEPPEFFVVDCSFISLRLILSAVVPLLTPDAEGVALIKPQFEAGRGRVDKDGVVRDPEVHEEVIQAVLDEATALGLISLGVCPSPLLGPAGNREFLAYFRRSVDI